MASDVGKCMRRRVPDALAATALGCSLHNKVLEMPTTGRDMAAAAAKVGDVAVAAAARDVGTGSAIGRLAASLDAR